MKHKLNLIKCACENSPSYRQVLYKIGYAINGPNLKTLKSIMEDHNLFLNGKSIRGKPRKTEEYLVLDGPSIDSKDLKFKLIKENLLKYKCFECSNEGVWQGRTLVLQLDHINGNNKDNRLCNLRLLCPNCHTQTPTWGRKGPNDENRTRA